MSATSKAMICPKCGATMNWHADKLIQGSTAKEARQADLGLGGAIVEMHSCPACGASASRLAA
jgi:ribosomal protein S27AE